MKSELRTIYDYYFKTTLLRGRVPVQFEEFSSVTEEDVEKYKNCIKEKKDDTKWQSEKA